MVGFLLASAIDSYIVDINVTSNYTNEKHQTGFRFISPLLECENSSLQGERNYSVIKTNISDYINGLLSQNNLTQASVYFRELNNGQWFGINQNDKFAPSSLLKLPVLIAYFKEADEDKSILDKEINYVKDPDGLIPQEIQPSHALERGKKYKISDLLYRMIVYSDNVSLRLLEDGIDSKLVDNATLDLNIPIVAYLTPNDFMSVKQYSTLFRILYNASYLSKDMSEKALELMSNTEYQNGLVAKLSDSILVSHKFGEREVAGQFSELHDCGIIYYPKRPYLLCIMTKGQSLVSLQPVIQQISKIVFDGIDSSIK